MERCILGILRRFLLEDKTTVSNRQQHYLPNFSIPLLHQVPGLCVASGDGCLYTEHVEPLLLLRGQLWSLCVRSNLTDGLKYYWLTGAPDFTTFHCPLHGISGLRIRNYPGTVLSLSYVNECAVCLVRSESHSQPAEAHDAAALILTSRIHRISPDCVYNLNRPDFGPSNSKYVYCAAASNFLTGRSHAHCASQVPPLRVSLHRRHSKFGDGLYNPLIDDVVY